MDKLSKQIKTRADNFTYFNFAKGENKKVTIARLINNGVICLSP